MKLILIVLCVITVSLSIKIKKNCEIEVKKQCYKKEIMAKGLNRPYQISYSKHNGIVYFSYNVEVHNKTDFAIGHIKHGKHKLPTVIKEVKNGFATAIDQENNIVYMGGSDGIYMEHLSKPKMVKIVEDHNIWYLFFKDHLYFITYPNLRLHKYKGNSSEVQEHIPEKIYHFVIDGDDDIFITNKTGLYGIKNGTNERILYGGNAIFRAVGIDNKGVAHFGGQNEIYIPNKHNHTLEKIVDIKNIFGVTFDEDDNIIYSNPHQIVKLVPEKH